MACILRIVPILLYYCIILKKTGDFLKMPTKFIFSSCLQNGVFYGFCFFVVHCNEWTSTNCA